VCFLAVLLAGCHVDQHKEIATYRAILDSPGQSVTVPAPGEPLTLGQALALANRHHEQLAIAGEDYLQALIDRQRATAAFLPTFALAPTYLRQDEPEGANRSTGNNPRIDTPLTGQISLFNGFRDVAALRQAARTIEQRRALLLDLQASILLTVAQTYYDVLSNEAAVRVLTNSLAVQEENVRYIHARRQAGTARPLDVAQSEARAATARVQLVRAQADVANARLALAFLTAAPIADSPLVDSFELEPLPDVASLMQIADRQRQDLRAADDAVAAARQGVEVAIGQYYPRVSLNLTYFLQRLSNPTDSQWSTLISANLPLFTGGVIHQDVREAWSLFRQALLRRSLLARLIERDVQIAMRELAAAQQQLAELQAEVSASHEAYRQADQSYNVGLATNLERLTAQDQLLSAQLDLARAEFARKIAYLNLLRVTGDLGIHWRALAPGETVTPTTATAPTTALANP
jgi:outer membrane protein TolC